MKNSSFFFVCVEKTNLFQDLFLFFVFRCRRGMFFFFLFLLVSPGDLLLCLQLTSTNQSPPQEDSRETFLFPIRPNSCELTDRSERHTTDQNVVETNVHFLVKNLIKLTHIVNLLVFVLFFSKEREKGVTY